MQIGDRIWIRTAVATTVGQFHETRELDGVILDLQEITEKNINVMAELLRAGHAEIYDPDKSKEPRIEDANILPDRATPGTRGRKRNLRPGGG